MGFGTVCGVDSVGICDLLLVSHFYSSFDRGVGTIA